jgi:DNA-binding NtrC family response regulator
VHSWLPKVERIRSGWCDKGLRSNSANAHFGQSGQDIIPHSPLPFVSRSCDSGEVSESKGILALEDDPGAKEFLEIILQKLGFEPIFMASSVSEAEECWNENKHRIQILLSDVFLPDGSGQDFALRLLAVHSELRAVLMTGYTLADLDIPAVFQSRVGLLSKPYQIQELETALSDCLKTSA